jgi:hypothetical protein
MENPNFQLLLDAARLLKPILGELVFAGGCTTALLITDKAAADVRPTFDVDAIAEITSYVGYAQFSERLRKLGFHEDIREGAPACRWCQQTTTLDVMPLDEKILGFSNTWYEPAMSTAEERELEADLKYGWSHRSTFVPPNWKLSPAGARTTIRAVATSKI